MMFRRNVLRTNYVALVESLRTFSESCRNSFRFTKGFLKLMPENFWQCSEIYEHLQRHPKRSRPWKYDGTPKFRLIFKLWSL